VPDSRVSSVTLTQSHCEESASLVRRSQSVSTYRPWPWPWPWPTPVAVADTSGPGRWPCQLSQMTLRMNIAGFTLSSYPVGFAPHEWLRSSNRTSLSVWALPVSIGSNLWSLPRSGLCCVWFGVFAFGLGLMGRTFGHTASTGAVTGVTLDPLGPFSRVWVWTSVKRVAVRGSRPPRTRTGGSGSHSCRPASMNSNEQTRSRAS
jgi:hypothetical protein